jgi:phage protein D
LRLGGAEKWTAEHPRFPSASIISRLIGSWETAQRAAGFTPRRRRWTKAAVSDALRRDAGASGSTAVLQRVAGASDEHPDPSTAVDRFGSWRAALAAAGLRR